MATGQSSSPASCPLQQREGSHGNILVPWPSSWRPPPPRSARRADVSSGGRRVDLRPPAGQGRRRLARRPAHRRPGPQRAVRVRRRRPVHRRRPRPRRRRQEADRRQGDHQGCRQERRLLHDAFAPNVYAGATAKAAVLAQSQGKNPRSFGGVDLVTQLEGRVATAAPITGRIEDAYDPTDQFGGDFANVIGQAYAAQALALAGSAKAGAATAFLLQQQCAKGFFRQYFTTDKTRADQSCQGAPAAERGASTDATALAVLALQDVKGAKAKAAVKKAVAWLDGHPAAATARSPTPARPRAPPTPTAPAWPAGRSARPAPPSRRPRLAAAAVRDLAGRATNPCARQAGQADRRDRLRRRRADGNGQGSRHHEEDSDQWRRASAQALPVLRWAPRAEGDFTVTRAARPSPWASTWRIRLTGVAAGERVCVSGGGPELRASARTQPDHAGLSSASTTRASAPTRSGSVPSTATSRCGSRADRVPDRLAPSGRRGPGDRGGRRAGHARRRRTSVRRCLLRHAPA